MRIVFRRRNRCGANAAERGFDFVYILSVSINKNTRNNSNENQVMFVIVQQENSFSMLRYAKKNYLEIHFGAPSNKMAAAKQIHSSAEKSFC